MSRLEQLVKELPPNLQREVEDFAQFLLEKRQSPSARQFLQQAWAGGLREFREQYSALTLQQQSLEWRGKPSCT
jgi:hypothetical protein